MIERITSRQNGTVKHIRALAKSRELREKTGEFVCEGEKLLYEAISENRDITCIIANEALAERFSDVPGARCFAVGQDILESITTLKSVGNVIFTCKVPKHELLKVNKAIILDGLQDTGNIGTIIRTADALGIDAIFAEGCADIYNPKTIRSAMGSVFRVPVINEKLENVILRLRNDGLKVYSSGLYGETVSITECDFSRSAVVIGNEGSGVRSEISSLCDANVIIPMQGGAESLNAAVAASIFMYKMSEG